MTLISIYSFSKIIGQYLNVHNLERKQSQPVADPGFPVGGGGRQPPMRTLFGENVCENERN